MKNILFVCLGNICRSPAAEGIFLHLLERKNLTNRYYVDSAGIVNHHVGELPDKRTRESGLKRGIDLISHCRQIEKEDLEKFDYILCMDQSNIFNVYKLDPQNLYKDKIKLLTDFRINLNHTEVPDPYWGNASDFDLVTDIIFDSCNGLLNMLEKK